MLGIIPHSRRMRQSGDAIIRILYGITLSRRVTRNIGGFYGDLSRTSSPISLKQDSGTSRMYECLMNFRDSAIQSSISHRYLRTAPESEIDNTTFPSILPDLMSMPPRHVTAARPGKHFATESPLIASIRDLPTKRECSQRTDLHSGDLPDSGDLEIRISSRMSLPFAYFTLPQYTEYTISPPG